MIPALASSWLLTEECELCGCDYPADFAGVCDNCSERETLVDDEEMNRITVQISTLDTPFYDEAVELTDADILEVIAA
jgi:hypothetical protein